MIDFSRNHFELLGLPARFHIDASQLDRAYRELQGEVHPDRHASAGDAERRLALQASARVNEAYCTLRDAMLRAQYLLSLHGIDAQDETDTALSLEFLESALERREEVADAAARKDEAALDALLKDVRAEARTREAELEHLLDDERTWEIARQKVRELKFLAKLAEDIDAAMDEVDT
ncbi:MAG: Fe-S protein assembly co-chaperone HscB [Pseudomonadota bacterium]|nr:Fe-S protein assembly co-chaperone HscB [Pseudomonadota bacterium]